MAAGKQQMLGYLKISARLMAGHRCRIVAIHVPGQTPNKVPTIRTEHMGAAARSLHWRLQFGKSENTPITWLLQHLNTRCQEPICDFALKACYVSSRHWTCYL
jgi:hypothetical protein